MEVNTLDLALLNLIAYWHEQSIEIYPNSKEYIEKISQCLPLSLPNDFVEMYLKVDGMRSLYPNYNDKEGFLFYPLETLLIEENIIMCPEDNSCIIVFMDYLLCCWWYGIKIFKDGKYEIGILPEIDCLSFKPICSSLSEFIALYIEDNELLYDWEK